MIKLITIAALWLAFIASPQSARADVTAYQAVVDLRAQGDDFTVLHHHDWSQSTRANRAAMMKTHQDPFRDDNNYGYIAWYTLDGQLVRRLPSPALTWLGVSPNSRYVIGLSRVMLDNPYQLVVYSRAGELLVKRHIAPEVACLTPTRYQELLRSYSRQLEVLRERVWTSGGVVYVDYLTMGMPERLGKLWRVLYPHTCRSPWSPNFSHSVTNWVFWYDEADPTPEVVETEGKPFALQLKDPKGFVVTVPFHLELPNR
jgi:hypothetical protein